MAGGAPPVDQAAQYREEIRLAMNLVQHDEAIGMPFEVALGIGEPGQVRRELKIQVGCVKASIGVVAVALIVTPWADRQAQKALLARSDRMRGVILIMAISNRARR